MTKEDILQRLIDLEGQIDIDYDYEKYAYHNEIPRHAWEAYNKEIRKLIEDIKND